MTAFLPGVLLGGGARELALTSCARPSLTRRTRGRSGSRGVRRSSSCRPRPRCRAFSELVPASSPRARHRAGGLGLPGQSCGCSGSWTGPSGFVEVAAGLFVAGLIPSALPSRSISPLRYCMVSLSFAGSRPRADALSRLGVEIIEIIHTNSRTCILCRDVCVVFERGERRELAARAGVLVSHQPRQDAAPDRARPANPDAGHRPAARHHRAQDAADRRRPRGGRIHRPRAGRAAQPLHGEHRPTAGAPDAARCRHRSVARGPADDERLLVSARRLGGSWLLGLGLAWLTLASARGNLAGLAFPFLVGSAGFLLLTGPARTLRRFPGSGFELGLERLFALLLPIREASTPTSLRSAIAQRRRLAGFRQGARRWGEQLQLIEGDGYETASRIAAQHVQSDGEDERALAA